MKNYFKIIFLGITLSIFFVACTSSASSEETIKKEETVKYLPPLTDLQKLNIKGKVKKYTEGDDFVSEYNESGFQVKHIRKYSSGEKVYNSDNILTEETRDGKKTTYTINSRNLIEKQTSDDEVTTFTYNKDFTQGHQEIKNKEGKKILEGTLKLNAKLIITESMFKYYTDDGGTSTNIFNDNNQHTSAIFKDEDGKVIGQYTIKYNDNHRETKYMSSAVTATYTYGADTFVSEENYKSGSVAPRITKYTYEVDDKGNWTKRTTTIVGNTNDPTVTTRTYEYY